MNEKLINIVNGERIVLLENNLVPIRPICKAIGIDFKSQYNKLKEDEDLHSVVVLSTTTGADGKKREMVCIPLGYVFGWLFTINPKNVDESARETVRRYRQLCYKILFDYFTRPVQFIKDKQTKIDSLDKQIADISEKIAKSMEERKQLKLELSACREVTIEDWEANNRQLTFEFEEK